jgi:hypothetical protein
MTGLETKIISIATNLATTLVKKGLTKALSNPTNLYTQELAEVITKTVQDYTKKWPVPESNGKIPFYVSEDLVQALLDYRLHREFDKELFRNIFQQNPLIIAPSREEITNFFALFDAAIAANEKLAKLNIDVNYKEEIFNISSFLDSFSNRIENKLDLIMQEIRDSKVGEQLTKEWNLQLEEIASDLKLFKAVTAKGRLENLEKRIREHGLTNNALFARLYNLLADTIALMHETDLRFEQAKLITKVYHLQPHSLEYKGNACVAYHLLKEKEKAVELSNELIAEDEFNVSGWIVRCLSADVNFKEVLAQVPVSVKTKNGFKLNLCLHLLNKRYVSSYKELRELGLGIELDENANLKISYNNLQFLHLCVTFLLYSFFERNNHFTSILYYEDPENDKDFRMALTILENSYKALSGTEIEDQYRYNAFEYHCCRYILSRQREDIIAMESIYEILKERKIDTTIRMMQGYNALKEEAYHRKTLALVDSNMEPLNEMIVMMGAMTSMHLNDKESHTKYFLKYLSMQSECTCMVFNNLIGILREYGLKKNEETKQALSKVLSNLKFERKEYELICRIFCAINYSVGDLNEHELNALIEEARETINPQETELSIHVAFAYTLTGQLGKARDYLRLFVNTNQWSESYLLYCKVLYNLPSDKVELLTLLRQHREKFAIDEQLLYGEFSLIQLKGDWKEAAKIAEKGVELFPDNEAMLRGLFNALNATVEIGKIGALAPKVREFNFTDQATIVNIAQILLRAQQYQDGIDLLYKYATEKHNTTVRGAYFMLSYLYPKGALKEFNEVQLNTVIKYQIDKEEYFVPYNESNRHNHPQKLFEGKSKGETFSFQRSLSQTVEVGKIERIMDKYLALYEEILAESKHPLSDLPMRHMKLQGDTIEEISQTFIDEMGIESSAENERKAQELAKFNTGKNSFSDVTGSVFDGNFIEAYYMLTATSDNIFRAFSPAYNRSRLTDGTRIAVDMTAICLFYTLHKDLHVAFKHKFLISPFVRDQFVKTLDETKNNRSSMSLNISMEKVVPTLYEEDFFQRRLEQLNDMLAWIDNNCIVEDLPERLDFLSAATPDQQTDIYFNILLDNSLLALREQGILLTNDIGFPRKFGIQNSHFSSPTYYLQQFHADQFKEICAHMLLRNYIGIPITAQMLEEEYLKMVTGKPNKLNICLENLKRSWNPEGSHIYEVVRFVKNLVVGSFVNDISRQQITQAVFQNLVVGMEDRVKLFTAALIIKEFFLLGLHREEVLRLFNDAAGLPN